MPKYGLISRIGQGAQGVLVKARTIEVKKNSTFFGVTNIFI